MRRLQFFIGALEFTVQTKDELLYLNWLEQCIVTNLSNNWMSLKFVCKSSTYMCDTENKPASSASNSIESAYFFFSFESALKFRYRFLLCCHLMNSTSIKSLLSFYNWKQWGMLGYMYQTRHSYPSIITPTMTAYFVLYSLQFDCTSFTFALFAFKWKRLKLYRYPCEWCVCVFFFHSDSYDMQ